MSESSKRELFPVGRLRRISYSIVMGLAIAVAFVWNADKEGGSLIRRGDFPAFYVLPIILERGESDKIYDIEFQRSIQNEFWPSFDGSFHLSVYPPYVALLLYPLVYLNPSMAQVLFCVLMLIAMVGSILILRNLNHSIQREFFAFLALVLSFAPVLVSILGAQNTAISMLLYAGVLYLSKSQTAHRDLYIGILIGLWFFKPQYGAIALCFTLLTGRWRTLFGASIPIAFYFTLASMVSGPYWIQSWLKATGIFAAQNLLVNGYQMTSFYGAGRGIVSIYSLGSDTRLAIDILSVTLSVLFAVIVSRRFIQNSNASDDLFHSYILLGPLMVLIVPQSSFYDLGISLIGMLTLVSFNSDRDIFRVLGSLILIGAVTLYREFIPIPIFVFVALWMFLWVMRFSRSQSFGIKSQAH